MLSRWSREHRQVKKRVAMALYQRKHLMRAAMLHATSEQEVEDIRSVGITRPIAMIPNGVDLPDNIRKGQSTDSTRMVLFLARMHKVKGIPLLLNAWSQVRPSRWELMIVGPDEAGYRKEMEALAECLGIASSVRFFGNADSVTKAALYGQAELFILPSHSENFGLVVAEALSYGVPVITTKGTPWKALATTGSGWWVDAEIGAIRSALADAVSRPTATLRAMGQRGRELIGSDYSWKSVAERLIRCYQWVLGREDMPAEVNLA
jgi:glycosyltransferase involved in cell wall biosynthesis